jgi:asparagine synthase (glutamine-hydrolysing)
MCGIAGFADFRRRTNRDDLRGMTDVLHHRGPDSSGGEFFVLPDVHVGLGHRRLSIIDLSDVAKQPLADENGNYLIVFNGEIYNYREIRSDLEKDGCRFRTASDTEVLLKAYMKWGLQAVHRFIGMFAFVIYDRPAEKLVLCRDRAGVKPLYYHYNAGLFLFASELKSFYRHPAFRKEISLEALSLYFKFGYFPAPYTVFEHTRKLEPGHCLELDLATGKLSNRKYWDVYDYYNMPLLDIGEREATDELERLLTSAFNYRMVADVPVGVFLSGGYDSTAVTAILQKDRTERLKTFTIGFSDKRYNEAHEAKAIAQYIGTDHTEHYCSEQDAKEIIGSLPYYYDEPFIDQSSIATMLVSRLAKERVTVALSADGGDEAFAGYDHIEQRAALMRNLDRIPGWARLSMTASTAPLERISRSYRGCNPYILMSINQLWKLRSRLSSDDLADLVTQGGKSTTYRIYRLLGVVPNAGNTYFYNFRNLRSDIDEISKCLAIDYQTNMADDMLTKVDRATMSVSLEGREPFLDHRIIEFAARLPARYKYDNGVRKKILKNIVHKYVPVNLMDRPKKGFGVPVGKWLRGDLSHLLDYHLDRRKLDKHGLFDAGYVSFLKKRYMATGAEYNMVWSILVFQMWYETWMEKGAAAVR